MGYDLTGQVFNDLIVLSKHPVRTSSKKVKWVCRCICGEQTTVTTQALLNGNTKSCGCRKVEAARAVGLARSTHGLTKTTEYKAWQSMRDRCYNSRNQQYKNYGARGIEVCSRWRDSFENFLDDMGPKPGPAYSIDREDNNGHYHPRNCRWATVSTQANNRRSNRKFMVKGAEKSLAELAREHDIPVATLRTRLLTCKMPLEKALSKESPKHIFTIGSETLSLREWADLYNIPYSRLYHNVITKKLPIESFLTDYKRSS